MIISCLAELENNFIVLFTVFDIYIRLFDVLGSAAYGRYMLVICFVGC